MTKSAPGDGGALNVHFQGLRRGTAPGMSGKLTILPIPYPATAYGTAY